jgi:hypothetical protein
VLSFLFERRHRVLLSRFGGTVGDAELTRQVRLASAFARREGPLRTIVDFTDVTDFTVDMRTITGLAARADRHDRVFIVPQPEIFGLARLFSTHNNLAGSTTPPSLVKTLAEAYAAFALDDPDFQPMTLD